MSIITYDLQIDKNIQQGAFEIIQRYGQNPSQVINAFLNNIVKTKTLPPEYRQTTDNLTESPFNFDLQRMKKAVESPSVVVPKSALQDFESFEKWANETF